MMGVIWDLYGIYVGFIGFMGFTTFPNMMGWLVNYCLMLGKLMPETYHGMGWFMTDPLVLMISADGTI
jgi:hypothetical protein